MDVRNVSSANFSLSVNFSANKVDYSSYLESSTKHLLGRCVSLLNRSGGIKEYI